MNCSYCGREVANLCVGRLGLLCVACHRDEMEQEDLLARRIAQPGEPDPSDTFGGPHVTVPLASTSLLAWPRPPEAPQAPLSDPADGTAKASPPSRESTPQGDPLTQTLALIPLSTHGPNLIKFLAQKTERTARVEHICKHIYKSIDKPTLAKARRLIGRNAECLEKRDAPLRIAWDKKTGEVRLIDR